jgi:hypothetical protein
MLGEGRVDRTGLDQRHGNRRLVHLQFHPERVGEALHRMLGCRIGALHRDGPVGEDGTDIDEGSAGRAQFLGGVERGLDVCEIVDVEDSPMLLHRDFAQPGIDAY